MPTANQARKTAPLRRAPILASSTPRCGELCVARRAASHQATVRQTLCADTLRYDKRTDGRRHANAILGHNTAGLAKNVDKRCKHAPSFVHTKGKRRWPSSDRREFPGNPSAAASSLSASSPNQTPAFPSRRYSRNFTTLGHTFVRLRQAGLPKPYQHLKKSKVMITRLTTGSGSAKNV